MWREILRALQMLFLSVKPLKVEAGEVKVVGEGVVWYARGTTVELLGLLLVDGKLINVQGDVEVGGDIEVYGELEV